MKWIVFTDGEDVQIVAIDGETRFTSWRKGQMTAPEGIRHYSSCVAHLIISPCGAVYPAWYALLVVHDIHLSR